MTDINTLNERTHCEQKIQEAVMAERGRICEAVKKLTKGINARDDAHGFYRKIDYNEAIGNVLAIINNNHE